MGVVYHANYIIWCELGRTQFMKDLGYSLSDFDEKNLMFPIRNVNVDYLVPCYYGETIIVETQIHSMNPVKFVYYHEIKDEEGTIKAKAYTTCISVDKNTFKIKKLNHAAPEAYQAYLSVYEQSKTK